MERVGEDKKLSDWPKTSCELGCGYWYFLWSEQIQGEETKCLVHPAFCHS